jgi:hypothetical protein
MEHTMNERKLQIGDVYLEPDGWGKVLVAADISGMGDERIVVWFHLKGHTFASTHTYDTLKKTTAPKGGVFLFNLGDLFHDATKKE